ncbi:DUF2155 domain-containing protein [Roseovarius faecimaris]|uniref:DUF2155 domain-containing protein n=1 Tax=Roseovarius faecimaris TaxID=2494550 RepID=A0A6I6IQY8_9RHOB|nr:DUF2155 domain-containing protein [Roseovarius faecimaris]QGX98494.1 DUF2155 domain-containing protein [Roseovarius faecimaris]
MIRWALLALLLTGQAAAAQQVATGTGAKLRWLDKVDGQVTDMDIDNNGIYEIGRLKVHLRECRFPAGNPTGDAYAFVTIAEEGASGPVFEGWMIASSPALNALEHPRYDVWVMRCKTP